MTKRESFLTQNAAYEKMQKYCAYQERCQQDVRQKLFEMGISSSDSEQIITRLIEDNSIDEERFSRAFSRGKFRIKHWGKVKIKHELKKKNISSYCITKGLQEIDQDEYIKVIGDLIEIKSRTIRGLKDYQKRYKIIAFLLGKGFEADLANEVLKELSDA